eukprot:COSAG06_NODE_19702_length_826_cov_0.705640_2_plen_31_part_01
MFIAVERAEDVEQRGGRLYQQKLGLVMTSSG